MPKLSLKDIAEITGGDLMLSKGSPAAVSATGYSFDTRNLKRGDLFFALRGEQRDGHAFVVDACGKGAVGAVVEGKVEEVSEDFVQIVVPSPLEALQKIASYVRSQIEIPVVAISGSNGKTTTKDMLAMLLASKMRVHKSPGNFNNHIGVPLSLLGLDESDAALVIELGSNHRGEIRELCDIARPTIGVVTNVGTAHIGHFGSVEEIAREKTDILRCVEPGGKGVVNADDILLMSALAGVGVGLVRFAAGEAADFKITDIRHIDGEGLEFSINGVAMQLKTPGAHNAYNAAAAVAAASLFGVSTDEASKVLASFEPLRMKITTAPDLTVIDDSYNANPDSVKAALDVISSMSASRKVFIMGEMLELGDEAEQFHSDVGNWVASSGVDVFVGIGGLTREAVAGARKSGMDPETVFFFDSKGEAKRHMRQIIKPHDLVLVKGSRMTGLEEICGLLLQDTAERRI